MRALHKQNLCPHDFIEPMAHTAYLAAVMIERLSGSPTRGRKMVKEDQEVDLGVIGDVQKLDAVEDPAASPTVTPRVDEERDEAAAALTPISSRIALSSVLECPSSTATSASSTPMFSSPRSLHSSPISSPRPLSSKKLRVGSLRLSRRDKRGKMSKDDNDFSFPKIEGISLKRAKSARHSTSGKVLSKDAKTPDPKPRADKSSSLHTSVPVLNSPAKRGNAGTTFRKRELTNDLASYPPPE